MMCADDPFAPGAPFNPGETLAALRHEEIEVLFDALDDAQFWIKDAALRYLTANQALLRNYTLRSVSEIQGLTDHDLSPRWLSEGFWKDDLAVLRGTEIVNRLELVGGVEGGARGFRTTKIRVRDREGRVAGTAGITLPLPGLNAPTFPVPELAPALQAIQRDPSHRWDNTELAKRVGLSVSAFERRFRRHLQTSPMRFVKRLRLAQAASALIQTPASVSEIALDTGFADQAHLTREFKQMYGRTPSRWRAEHGVRG